MRSIAKEQDPSHPAFLHIGAYSALRANSSPPCQPSQSRSVMAVMEATAGRHRAVADGVCTHTALDLFAILKADLGARHEGSAAVDHRSVADKYAAKH
jgi:hypothetical protein